MVAARASAEGEHVSREQRERWAAVYHTNWRTVLRWREVGLKRKDPCPLDNPSRMPAWWAKNMKHPVPEKVMAAARATESNGTNGDANPQDRQQQQQQQPRGPIDITLFDLNEGEAVRLQRQIVGALYNDLKEAYAKGWPTDKIQSDYTKAAKALRELERDDREDRVHRGRYIAREIYERDAAVAADMLRQMHDSMTRRVHELCPGLSPKHRHLVTAALTRVLSTQARVLQRLHTFDSTDALLGELAAA